MKKDFKGFTLVEGLIILGLITLLAFGAWHVFSNRHKNTTSTDTTTSSSQNSTITGDFTGKYRFGMATGVEMFNDTDANFNAQMQGIKAIGASWVRSAIAWQATETSRGTYDWTKADRLVNTTNSLGLKLIADVTEAPSWSVGTSNYGCSGEPNTDFSLEDYANFVNPSTNVNPLKSFFISVIVVCQTL